jgi:hypothetical protein
LRALSPLIRKQEAQSGPGSDVPASVDAGVVEFDGCADSSDCPALHECLPLSAGPDSGEISFDSVGPAMATLMRVACQPPQSWIFANACYPVL